MKWKQVRKLFPIIGLGIFIYLLLKLDVVKVFQEIKNVNLFYLSVAFVFLVIFFITQTLKWFFLARKQKINIPFIDAFKINLISSFYGFVTPSKLGSIMRIDYLKRYGGNTGKGISNFVIDKVLDLSSLFVLVVGFGFIFYAKLVPTTSWFLIFSVFILMIIFSFIFYKKEVGRPILKFIHRVFVPKRFKERGKELFDSFYQDMPSLGAILLIFIVNIINWIIDYILIYYISLSLGINISFIPFLVIMIISTLVAQIPITINGLGTRELTMISLFALFGIESIKVFSLSILNIIITNIIPAIFAIILLFGKEFKRDKK
jgi:uncharacterized protein (TIRG00374 family)